VRVGRKRVARLMRNAGIVGVHRRRRHGLTRRDPAATAAPDLVGRRFTPPAPDRLWVADITQQRTGEGWLYLAVVLDCFSRRIVGWSMAEHLRTELVLGALDMAVSQRQPAPGPGAPRRPRLPVHQPGVRPAAAGGWLGRLDGHRG